MTDQSVSLAPRARSRVPSELGPGRAYRRSVPLLSFLLLYMLAADPASADPCPAGQRITEVTAGKCCWAGQAWNGQRCVGIPTSCAEGQVVSEKTQSCEPEVGRRGPEQVDRQASFEAERSRAVLVAQEAAREAAIAGQQRKAAEEATQKSDAEASRRSRKFTGALLLGTGILLGATTVIAVNGANKSPYRSEEQKRTNKIMAYTIGGVFGGASAIIGAVFLVSGMSPPPADVALEVGPQGRLVASTGWRFP
jgi:hypothetical protein